MCREPVFLKFHVCQLGTTKNGQETSFLGLKQTSTCKQSSQILGPQTLQTGNGLLVVLLHQVRNLFSRSMADIEEEGASFIRVGNKQVDTILDVAIFKGKSKQAVC